jgi:hypothetical protein
MPSAFVQWDREAFSNRRTSCCDKEAAVRSSYSMSDLEKHVQHGLKLEFFQGSVQLGKGLEANTLNQMRESSGGSALQTAISLCEGTVDVYGMGLLSLSGASGDKIYTHSYDDDVAARCVHLHDAAEHLRKTPEKVNRMRWSTKSKWKTQRIRSELLLHIMHVLGIVRWRQC